MLEIKGLTKYFGGLAAVNGLEMTINQGEIVGLIGPNGAGKTTTFDLITGFVRPTRGKVILEGKDITGQRPHSIAEKGMVRTFQRNAVFSRFTVLQNVVAACHIEPKIGFWEAAFHTSGCRRKEGRALRRASEILELVGLDGMEAKPSRNLSHGHQRLLGIAVALAARPKLLLLDEPLSGMSTEEVVSATRVINEIRRQGTTILLIEHNMRATMSLCQRITVLNFGTKIAEGPPEAITQDKEVIQAYLGVQSGYAART